MKKFYTLIPHQIPGNLVPYRYQAVGNPRLDLEEAVCFPILTAFAGYTEPDEDTVIVAAVPDGTSEKANLETLRGELAHICELRGLRMPELREVPISESQDVSAQAENFRKLILQAEDDDELFCCMTFGTKPQSTAVMTAVQYAYRVKNNTSLDCIVYGEVVRPGTDKSAWYGKVYDMTALIRMDEIVHMLADNRVTDPEAVIDALLGQ